MRLLIRGARVVDPARGVDEVLDVLVADGVVAAVGRGLDGSAARGDEIFEAGGCIVAPGFVDAHVHLRDPGQEGKENIASGTRAAAAGGVTSVLSMANTDPPVDNKAVLTYIKHKVREEGAVDVYPVACLTKGMRGEEIAELATLAEAGAVAFSDDGRPVAGAEVMRRALEYAGGLGLPVIAHCEDPDLAAGGVANEGYPAMVLGLKGIPAAAEEVMAARDMILAGAAGARLHLAHVSTAGTVGLLGYFKGRGVRVTAEATPHHLSLTDDLLLARPFDADAKVNPPLRGEGDAATVREGLAAGIIDIIATDHAPHKPDEKAVEFRDAPFGLIGLELALPLIFTHLVEPGILSAAQVVDRMSAAPARIFGLPSGKGTLAPGISTDLVVIDPAREVTVDPARFQSKGRNTPLAGRTLRGAPILTVARGRMVFREDRILV